MSVPQSGCQRGAECLLSFSHDYCLCGICPDFFDFLNFLDFYFSFLGDCSPERVWVISMARLRTLPPVHLPPIDVLVLNDPYMEILS